MGILDKMRPCRFFREVKMPNGKWKCRCQFDGSIRNHCRASCPHFTPTIWWKLRLRRDRE